MALNTLSLDRPEDEEDPLNPNPLAMPGIRPTDTTQQTTEPVGGGGGSSAPMPGLALQVVQPPEEVIRNETTGPQETVTRKEVHPEVVKAEEKLDQAFEAKQKAAIKEQEAKTQISEVEQKAAQERADRMRVAQLEREMAAREQERREIAHQKQVEAAVAEREKERQALSEAEAGKKRGYWEDKSAPERILKAFLAGLSTYAHVRGGGQGPGPAYGVLQDEIARDRQEKLDKLDAAKEAFARAEGRVKEAKLPDDWYEKKRQRIDDEAAANQNVAEAQWGALAKGLGTAQAASAFQQLQADLEMKRQQDKAQLFKDKDTEIRNVGARRDYSRTTNRGGGPDKGPMQDPNAVRDLYGNIVGRIDKQESVKMHDAWAATHGIGQTVAALKADIKKNGLTLKPGMDASLQAERDAMITRLAGYLTVANQTGVLNKDEFERYKDIATPSVFASIFGDKGDSLGRIVHIAGNEYNNKLAAHGLTPAKKSGGQGASAPAATPGKSTSAQVGKPAGKEMKQLSSGRWVEKRGERWVPVE